MKALNAEEGAVNGGGAIFGKNLFAEKGHFQIQPPGALYGKVR